MKRFTAAGLGISACIMLLCRIFPGAAEFFAGFARLYARAAANLTGRTAVPVAEIAALLLLARAAAGLLRAALRREIGRWAQKAGAAAAVLILLYAAAWYPLYCAPSALPVAVPHQVSREAMERLAVHLAEEAAPQETAPAAGFAKRARYPEWMEWLNLNGIYIPMTGEAIVKGGDRFVMRHEEMHALGIADEGQANILAYEACMREGGAAAADARRWALKSALGCLSGEEKRNPFGFLGRGTGNYGDLALYLAARFDAEPGMV